MRYRGGLAAGLLCAAIALVGVSGCTAGGPPAPPPPPAGAAAPPAAGAGTPAAGQQAALTQGYQRALALTQFGGLGGAQGVGDQVKALGPELEQQGKDLESRIRALADAQQLTLGDQLTPPDESALTQLRGRSGPPFDTAWLDSAQQLEQQARDWATGVLNDPSASPDAQGGARDLTAKLDALAPRLQAAVDSGGTGSASAGAGGSGADGSGTGGNSASGPTEGTGGSGGGSGSGSGSGDGTGNAPRSVDSGTGGQAATAAGVLPGVLIGLGIVLLGTAGFGLRRPRRS
jgi:Domain of unknown function (DUF4142)